MTVFNIDILKSKASGRKKEFKAVAAKIKSMKVKDADRLVNGLHENEFETINCLECANCCKSLGPRLS
ncbi:MAG: hypothetical protein ACFCUM_16085, partial [Bacteroidales bacterium]